MAVRPDRYNKVKLPRIFLIGMPFVGKSYWGRQVAENSEKPFVDLDEYIAEKAGSDITHLFATLGEPGFRELERTCMLEVISSAPEGGVIACGGGTPCYLDNMKLLKRAGTVVYLQAPVSYLLANSLKSTEPRPLLGKDVDLSVKLQQLLEERHPVYAKAHYILQVEDITLTTFELTCILV
jgi:shikimate kinase